MATPEAFVLPAVTRKNFFQHPEAHPYVLDLVLLQKYGPEFLEWEMVTLQYQVAADFNVRAISDLNMSKIQAVKTLHLVDSFWTSWEVFTPVTMALNDILPDFEVAQVPTTAQCAVAVDITSRIRSGVAWSDELLSYLDVVHRHDGIMCSIEPLEFVQIEKPRTAVNCEDVMEKWPSVRKAGRAPTDDSAVSEQLRRLLLVHEAVLENQAQLASQLQVMLHG